MKNLKIWSLALALLMVVTGCEEKAATDNFKAGATNIVGEWQLTKWDGEVAPYDVYVNFDGAEVVIYQRVYSSLFEQFTGTYTLSGNTLTGMYNDGTEFGPYRAEVVREISFDDDGNIHVKNTSAYWIPELTLTEEISGTIYTVTCSYEGEDSFIRKLERIASRKFTNELGGHQ